MRLIIRARLWLLCLLAPLLLGGCSAMRFVYGQAPDLTYWWLDSYVDFSEAQSPKVREDLARWFAWHRGTQLPRYAQALGRMQPELMQDTTPAAVCRWWDELQTWRDALVEQALPAFSALALDLHPSQLDHLQRRFVKSNEEFRKDYLQDDPRERQREALKRAVDRAEMLYGNLDEAQRQWVAQRVAASPFDPQRWYAERQRRQQDTLQTLRSLAGQDLASEQAQTVLRAFFRRLAQSPAEGYRSYAAQLTSYNCEFAAQLHNRTSPAQRRVAQDKFKGWEADLRTLAANGQAR